MDSRQVADAAATDLVSGGVMNILEAAEYARLSRAEIYRAMGAGELAFVKVGRRRMIPKNAIIAWLGRHLVAAAK